MSDDALERRLSRLLSLGSWTSLAFLVAGLAVLFGGGDIDGRSTADLVAGVDVGGAGAGLIIAGVVLMIATPVCRVVVTLVDNAGRRDWRFVACNVVVLLLIAAALWTGHAAG
jgi:uncharacterized membrane protein